VGTSSLRRLDLAVYAQNDDRLPADLILTVREHELDLVPWEGWFKPLPLPIDPAEALNKGLDLNAGGIKFTFGQEDAHALGYDDDLGRWVTADRLNFGERYGMLIRTSEAAQALTFLRRASAIPPTTREGIPGLPSGWSLIDGVRIDVQPATAPPEAIAPLIPAGSGPRLRLEGGLRVSSERHVYLRGGEPALVLSSLVEDDEFKVEDVETGTWNTYRVPDDQNREAPLWELKLEPGDYDVTHGSVSIRFTIVDGIAETAGPGVGSITHKGRDGARVTGVKSTLSAQTPSPITVPAPHSKADVFLVGPNLDDFYRVEIPTWIQDHLGWRPAWRDTDAWVDFEPAWVIVEEGENATARSMSPLPPAGHMGTAAWSTIVAKADLAEDSDVDVAEVWELYREAATK
jgi:hypothetical protein